jgi:hypothetical protein
MFAFEIDTLGNAQWMFNNAIQVNMNSPSATYNQTTSILSTNATTSYTLTTPVANISGDQVNLGTAPAGGVVDGVLLNSGLGDALVAFATAIVAAAPSATQFTVPAYGAALAAAAAALLALVPTSIETATSNTVLVSP